MGQRVLKYLRSLPVLIAAGLFALYLLTGFFLVDPIARKVLPWAGDRFLASRLSAERVDFNPLTLELHVQHLMLAEPSGALLAGFDRLDLDLAPAGIARWAWRIRSLSVQRPRVNVSVRRGGALNWAALMKRVQEGAGPPSQSMARVLVDHLRIADGNVSYVDADRPGEAFHSSFAPLGIELDGLSTLPEDRGDYLLAAKLPEDSATLRWKGEVALNPLASQGELQLEGARLGRLVHAMVTPLAAQTSGTLGVTLHYRFAMLRSLAKTDVPSLEIRDAQAVARGLVLAPQGGGAPLLQVDEARVSDASFDLVRRELKVGAVQLTGGKVRATRDVQGAVDWQALWQPATPAGPATGTQGTPEASWTIAVGDLRLADWSAQWTDQGFVRPLTAQVDGFALKAALSGELGTVPHFTVGPLEAAAGPVQLLSGAQPMAQVERIAVSQAQAQWPQQRIAVEAVNLSHVHSNVVLDHEQHLNWVEMLRRVAQPRTAAPAPDAPAAALPDLRIARVAADDIQLRVVDASSATPVTFDIVQGAVAVRDVGLDLARALPVEAKFAVRQGGRFEARGTVVPAKSSGQFDLALAGFALQPLAPYVNQFARLRLQSGAAATRGKLAFRPGKAGIQATYQGGVAIDDLAIIEEDTGEPFLGWKKLSTDSLSLALGPDRVHIGELVAVNPLMKVIIFEDHSLNLERMRRTSAARPAVQPAASTTTAAAPPFPLAIERLRVVGADAEFADLSLTPRFGTKMQELSGVVTGLSTDPAASAQVELDGKVDDYGSARIRGSIQPFRATESTDLALAFRNLEMTRLTPYSGKFAGRRIESGRLSVDLEYKIKQRQLAGTNKFIVNKLKLGETVDSPDATKLPLDLAIALLEDSNGVIDLDLPVSGSLDDPKFSYGAIVWKAIVNVLTKIATAPFRALAGLLGSNSEKFESAGFDPGSSALLPPEREKLKLLAEALAKRPSLSVTIQPGFDPEADRNALQDAAMRREAAAAAGVSLAAGEAPGPVDVNVYKVQTWLEDRYAKKLGQAEYDKLRASFRNPNANTASRVMDSEFVERLGRRFKSRDGGPPSAFHAELLQRLTRKEPVADEALVKLAQARADALRGEIVKFGLDAGRVTVAAPHPQALKDKMVGSGLALGAGPGAAAAVMKTSSR